MNHQRIFNMSRTVDFRVVVVFPAFSFAMSGDTGKFFYLDAYMRQMLTAACRWAGDTVQVTFPKLMTHSMVVFE
jgi:hypothetical protein